MSIKLSSVINNIPTYSLILNENTFKFIYILCKKMFVKLTAHSGHMKVRTSDKKCSKKLKAAPILRKDCEIKTLRN